MMGRAFRLPELLAQSKHHTSRTRQTTPGLSPYHRRLICEPLEDRRLLSVTTLADLPAAAQHAISSAIGQDQSAYYAASGAVGVALANPANRFTAQLQSGTLHVSSGSDAWNMSLVGLGYDGVMQPVGTAQTSVNGNRVDCSYGMIDEWYVNGPGGLEQGFNVTPPPQFEATGSLTVELALSGDLRGTVNAAGDGLALTRPDGSAALAYTGLVAYDATGKTLPASLEVRADAGHPDLLIHVSAAGAQGPITIDPYVQGAMLTGSDTAPENFFGTSVAISGDTVVVGAVYGPYGTGAAYVFREPSLGWADMFQTAELISSDRVEGDSFGESVAISGNTVVVGASGANGSNGAAYVFTEPASGWANMTETAKLTASDVYPDQGSVLGESVSIDGDTVVVGARGADSFDVPPVQLGSSLPVHGARLRLGQHDRNGQARSVRWRIQRRFRLVGFDQRQHGGGRSAERHGRRRFPYGGNLRVR